MQVLYGEGLVNHAGPESCMVTRKGAIEALTGGVRAGLSSREKCFFQGADVFPGSEGNIGRDANDEPQPDPARSKNHGTYTSFLHGNREIPTLTGPDAGPARATNLKRARLRCPVSGSQTNP